MKIEQCRSCTKVKNANEENFFCKYHEKYISEIENCSKQKEYKHPVCENKECKGFGQTLDIESVTENGTVYKCFFCKEIKDTKVVLYA